MPKIKHLFKGTRRPLISRYDIGWKVKLTMRLNYHVIWIQPNKVNINEMDCGRWNECDGLWTERNKNETWSMKCDLKEMRWNMNNEVWTDGNKMKLEQWSRWCNIPLFEFNDFTSGSKINVTHSLFLFFFLFLLLKN